MTSTERNLTVALTHLNKVEDNLKFALYSSDLIPSYKVEILTSLNDLYKVQGMIRLLLHSHAHAPRVPQANT